MKRKTTKRLLCLMMLSFCIFGLFVKLGKRNLLPLSGFYAWDFLVAEQLGHRWTRGKFSFLSFSFREQCYLNLSSNLDKPAKKVTYDNQSVDIRSEKLIVLHNSFLTIHRFFVDREHSLIQYEIEPRFVGVYVSGSYCSDIKLLSGHYHLEKDNNGYYVWSSKNIEFLMTSLKKSPIQIGVYSPKEYFPVIVTLGDTAYEFNEAGLKFIEGDMYMGKKMSLQISPTFIPKEVGLNEDSRELGIRVYL